MKVFATFTLLILFLFGPYSSDALTLATPSWDSNIANLVKHTDLVVLGKVTGMRLIPEAHSTSITLSVESVIKGDPAVGDRLLRFRVMGKAGMKKHRGKRINWHISGSLKFRLGERLLLFMIGSQVNYHIFRPGGKVMVTDNKVLIPYTYKISQFDEFYNEMRERNTSRAVELPLDLVVKVAKASIADYDAIMAIEAEVSKAVSLTRDERQHASPRTTLSVELLKRLEETAIQILGKRADSIGISRLESVDGERKPIADESVEIPDPNLRAEIERELSRTSIAPITAADMESLTTLEADRADISDLTGLEAAINLTALDLFGNDISDISPLLGLPNLTDLTLSHTGITDLSVLSGLTHLTALDLFGNDISDISPLSGLPHLTKLVLSDVGITDLSMLSGLTNLTYLWLSDNNITDLSPLSGLANLTNLMLSRNSISDISALSGLTNLTRLELGSNSTSDISALSGLTHLTRLELGNNSIIDISPLSGLTHLTRLELHGNSITDISPLSGLANLTNLTLNSNSVSDISALSKLPNLVHLTLRNNAISDLSPLISNTGFGRDNSVSVDGNPLSVESINIHIPTLQRRGVRVRSDTPVNIPDPNLRAKIEVVIESELGKPVGESITLDDMAMLTTLEASNANINDLTGLEAATSLTWLYLGKNNITDISALAALATLTELSLFDNSISDISPLVPNTELGSEDIVDVRGNPLNAESINTHIPALQSRGVEIFFK